MAIGRERKPQATPKISLLQSQKSRWNQSAGKKSNMSKKINFLSASYANPWSCVERGESARWFPALSDNVQIHTSLQWQLAYSCVIPQLSAMQQPILCWALLDACDLFVQCSQSISQEYVTRKWSSQKMSSLISWSALHIYSVSK